MSTTTTPTTNHQPPTKLDLQFVPPDMRADFDAAVTELVGVVTPPPGISDVLMASVVATDVSDAPDTPSQPDQPDQPDQPAPEPRVVDTAAVAYMQVRHVVTPIILTEGNQHALAPMLDVFTSQLRAHVRETELATHTGVSPDTDRGLSYDVYVPDGAGLEPPDGFEVLPIRVWRRRVC